MKNNKGFTLVELLAVIVILAILMVSAGAAVMSTLNNARVNTFKNEALAALDVADNMYTEISMDANDSNTYLVDNDAHEDVNAHTYKAMCVTLQGLVTNGYLDKDVGQSGTGAVRGVILIEVPFDGGATKKTIWMTNSTHAVTGYEESKISSLKFKNENNSALKTDSGTLKYWQTPANTGVVTDISVADQVIYAANGKTNKIPSETGSDKTVEIPSGNGWTTLASADSIQAFSKDTPHIRLPEMHSPAADKMGGTNAVYTNIICINGPIS